MAFLPSATYLPQSAKVCLSADYASQWQYGSKNSKINFSVGMIYAGTALGIVLCGDTYHISFRVLKGFFPCFATDYEGGSLLCRNRGPVSHASEEKMKKKLGMGRKPPYLCGVNQTKQVLNDI